MIYFTPGSSPKDITILGSGSGSLTGPTPKSVASFLCPAMAADEILYVELSIDAGVLAPAQLSCGPTDNTINSFCATPVTIAGQSQARLEISASRGNPATTKKFGFFMDNSSPNPTTDMGTSTGISLNVAQTLYIVLDQASAPQVSWWAYQAWRIKKN